MRVTIFLLGLAIYGQTFGQSVLPPCQGGDMAFWSDCRGTFTAFDGSKYVGEWRNNKQSGQGVLTLPDGDKYVGEFLDGEINGQGTLFFLMEKNKLGSLKIVN